MLLTMENIMDSMWRDVRRRFPTWKFRWTPIVPGAEDYFFLDRVDVERPYGVGVVWEEDTKDGKKIHSEFYPSEV